jgi:ABC-type Fe3+-hydroxamate transport system substrate-binding protein
VLQDRIALFLTGAVVIALAACSSSGSVPSNGNNASAPTVTVTVSGTPTAGLTVVESSGFNAATSPGTPTGVIAQQVTTSNPLGQTTFFGIFVSGTYCFSVTSGAKQAYQCFTNNVPTSLTLAL